MQNTSEKQLSIQNEPAIEYNLPIKSWEVADRPREKFMQRGPDALSDAELIGLIFGTGTRTSKGPLSAIQLGQSLLKTYGGLNGLEKRDLRELTRISGIGPAKAVQMMAAFEIGRRVEASAPTDRIQVTAPEDVADVYGPRLRKLKKEIFMIILLNSANVIIGDKVISEGGLASSIVEPRAVFQHAILENAASIICMHNHPSGNTEPSIEDINVTHQLVSAGKLMGVSVHDHIIIAGKKHTSLAERGLMTPR